MCKVEYTSFLRNTWSRTHNFKCFINRLPTRGGILTDLILHLDFIKINKADQKNLNKFKSENSLRYVIISFVVANSENSNKNFKLIKWYIEIKKNKPKIPLVFVRLKRLFPKRSRKVSNIKVSRKPFSKNFTLFFCTPFYLLYYLKVRGIISDPSLKQCTSSRSTFEFTSRVNLSGPSLYCTLD